MAFRLDRGTLSSPTRTDTGLHVDAYITRVGVFEYINPDGSKRYELRPPEEVSKPESLASFVGAPVTNDHPPGRVDTKNATQYMRGIVGESVRMDGDKVAARLFVKDADLIARMDAGKVEVSCGYSLDEDWTPGTWNGQRYDLIQRNIRGNHVAIVDAGRAGPEVRVRMDAAEQTFTAPSGMRIDAMDEMQKQLTAALVASAEQKARADKLEAERDAQKQRADKLEAERDAEKQRADNAEKQRADAADPKRFDARVAARVALVAAASNVLRTDGKPDDLSGKTDREIKVAFIERVDGMKIDASKTDDYVDAYYDSANKRADAAVKSTASARQIIVDNRNDNRDTAGGDPETAAMQRMQERNSKRGDSRFDEQPKGSN